MDKGSSGINSYKGNTESKQSLAETPSKSGLSSTSKPIVSSHVSKGEYTVNSNRHIAGGHMEESIKEMERLGIEYNITETYPNGVRVGNIPNSKNSNARKPNSHTWFPASWTEKDVADAANYVQSKIKNPKDNVEYTRTYKGVRTTIVYNNGKLKTTYPNKIQKRGKKK